MEEIPVLNEAYGPSPASIDLVSPVVISVLIKSFPSSWWTRSRYLVKERNSPANVGVKINSN